MAEETLLTIPEPNLPPPTPNIIQASSAEVAAPAAPTPAEIAEYEKTAGPVPSRFNPIKELSAQELADLAVQDPEHFDVVSAFRQSPELHADSATVDKAAEALNILKQRGFKLSDLPSPVTAGKSVIQAAKGFGKQVWNYANVAGDIVQGAILDAAGGEAGHGIATELGTDINRRLSSNIAGTEEAMTGLAELGGKAVGKVGRLTGISKDFSAYTPDEKKADLWAEVGKAQTQQERLTGKGAFTQAVTRGTAPELNPEETATLAAGDPFSFYLFGKAGALAGAAVPAGIKTAIAAGSDAVTQAAGRAAQAVGGKALEVTGKVVGGTTGLIESTAPYVAPVVGAVKGGAIYGSAGVAGGFIAGERVGKLLAKGAAKVGAVADTVADIGKQIASSAPVTSAYAQAGKDFLTALPGAAFETAKGAALDLGLAAASAETPQETQGAAGFGTVLGALHGTAKLGGRVISGQIIAPRAYGVSTPQPSTGNFPTFDAMHNTAFQTAPVGVKARLNALRQFVNSAAPGTDVFFSSDPIKLSEALQGSGLSKEQADAWSEHQGFFSAEMPDKNGVNQKMIVVTNPDSAPHEAFHAIQDVIGEQGNQEIDKIVKQSYADRWDEEGTKYAERLNGGKLGLKTWEETVLDASGKGMNEAKEKIYQSIFNAAAEKNGVTPDPTIITEQAKEVFGKIMDSAVTANPQIDPNQIALHVWREVLSPEESRHAADTFIARELAAENFDAIFKHTGQTLTEGTQLSAKLARIAGRVMTALGIEPLAGRTSEGLGVPLSTPVVEAVKGMAKSRLPEVTTAPIKSDKSPIGKTPVVTGTPAEQAKTLADTAPDMPTEKGTQSPRALLGAVAEAISTQSGIKINYLSAPGEPAAATTSNREVRRNIIEAFRDMPDTAKALWEKTFFPERVRQTKAGKYQIFGWAPEVFASNAHKMAGFLTDHTDLSPYAIDATSKSFTPAAWQELYNDVQTFVQNQKAGQTGAGEPLVVPKNVTDRGFFAPPTKRGASVPLEQNKADFINMLFNAKLPETPRVQSGKLPLNIAGQEVSVATKPGRVEIPVRLRGEYAGTSAEQQGIAGRQILEVNPLRNQIEAAAQSAGKAMPSLIEANQWLNLDNIKETEIAPEQPEFRANTLTLQAGFQPATISEITKDLPVVPRGMVRLYHGEGGFQGGGTGGSFYTSTPEKAATYGPKLRYVDVSPEAARIAKEAAKKIGQGGDTAILTRADVERAKLVEREVAPITYDLDTVAQFSPKENMENLKMITPEDWTKKTAEFKGKYGGGLTGWAYEVGSEARTPEDLQNFISTGEIMSTAGREAMKAGNFDAAMSYITRAQAANEAYEAATGKTVTGHDKDVRKFIHTYDPTYQYPMPSGVSSEVKTVQMLPGESKNDVHQVAEDYTSEAGINYNPRREFAPVNEKLLKRISDFYQEAKHAPNDANVKKSYDALASETEAQYRAIEAAGYTLEPFTGNGEPYKSSGDMVKDVRDNKHLYFLATDKAGDFSKNNVMMKDSGVNGWPVNDLFRAVHDFFGHAKEGYQFGPKGEFNAWKSHSEMYSIEAQGALAAETLAQNAFVNFGPHMRGAEGNIRQKGEPGFLGATERPFAEQKNVVVPESMMREAQGVQALPKTKDELTFKPGKTGFSKAWILPDGKPVQLGGTWHHEWLANNSEVSKKYNLTVPPFEGGDSESVREGALKKGFVRVNLNRNTGELVVEARAKDWRKQKNIVQDIVERNLDDVDKMRVTLLDETATKVVDSSNSNLFNYDTDIEKLSHLPLISEEVRGGQFMPGKFEDAGFEDELKKIRTGKSGGQTFNTDGTVWSPASGEKSDIVTLASVNVPQGDISPATFSDALAPYADLLDEGAVKAGVFSFSKGGTPTVSIDINAVVPQEFRANSVNFAKANDQVSIWDSAKNEEVKTGGKGNTKLTKPNEILDALDSLTTGQPVDINEIKRQYAEAGAAEEQGIFFGGAEYPGNAAVANMTKAELAKKFPEVLIPRRRNESIPSEITKSPLYEQAGGELEAVDAFARRLVEFANEYSSDPSFKVGAEWYSNFVPKLKKEFGKDAQLMAELLAATSPQTNVQTNFAYAYDALQSLKSGRFDKSIKKFNEGLDMLENGKWEKAYNRMVSAGEIPKPPAQPTPAAFIEGWINKHDLKPRQSNGALYGTHSLPVLQVFARKWLTESRGPKTLNFVKNLVGTGHEATIDLWADRTMRRVGYAGFKDKWRILPGNVEGVSAADFAFSQKAFRKAAEQLEMQPDALQGALWFAEKKLYHEKGWGRLDLGDFQTELAKVPMLKQGYAHRVQAAKGAAAPAQVTPDLFTVEPRKK